MSTFSERVCQFFLRGRCQREDCEFKHDKSAAAAAAAAASKAGASSYSKTQQCRFFSAGRCKFRDKCRFRHEKPGEKDAKGDQPKASKPTEEEVKRKVTEPKETEAKVTEPTETEPTETEPKETEPKEMEPKETEPKETEPKETEPKETAEMNPPKAPVPAGDESVSVASGFSDEEESVGSGFDDESIASGFTESPSKAKNKDKEAVLKKASNDGESEKGQDAAEKDVETGKGEPEKSKDAEKATEEPDEAPKSSEEVVEKAVPAAASESVPDEGEMEQDQANSENDKTGEDVAKDGQDGKEAEAAATNEDAAKAGTEEVAKAGTEDVAQAGTEDVAQAGTEDVAQGGAEDVAQGGAEDVAQAGAEDVAKAGTEDGATNDEAGTKDKEKDETTNEDGAINKGEGTASKPDKGPKEIRRDSKGFERFEDYFSDSDADKTGEAADNDNSQAPAPADESMESIQEADSPQLLSVRTPRHRAARAAAEKKDASAASKSAATKKKGADDAEDKNAQKAKSDKDEEAPADKQAAASTSKEKTNGTSVDAEETIEDIMSFIQDEPAPADSGATRDKTKKKDSVSTASVEEIFGGNSNKVAEKKKSVYDLEPDGDEFSVSQGTTAPDNAPSKPKSGGKPRLIKKEGVTMIGNNTFIYTGGKKNRENKDGDNDPDDDDDDDDEESTYYVLGGDTATTEDDDDNQFADADDGPSGPPASKKGKTYGEGRRKHRTNYVYGAKSTAAKTRRCGECEGCNREDCGTCHACKDKPKFGGKNSKKQACQYRVCTWKNPGGTKRKGDQNTASKDLEGTPVAAPVKAAAIEAAKSKVSVSSKIRGTTTPKRGRQSIPVISPASVPGSKRQRAAATNEERRPEGSNLTDFDRSKYTPGQPMPIVKKGGDEYMIVLTGVKDTGLCGKYWADIDNLPPRRRRGSNQPTTPQEEKKVSQEVRKRGAKRKQDEMSSGPAEVVPSEESLTTPPPPKRGAAAATGAAATGTAATGTAATGTAATGTAATTPAATPTTGRGGRRRSAPTEKASTAEDESVKVVHSDFESSDAAEKATAAARQFANGASTTVVQKVDSAATVQEAAKEIKAAAAAADVRSSVQPGATTVTSTPGSDQSRSVTCVADTSTQREVVVECFAPYDDHRWVNIGKERDGMAPDAVQYARALRPPYHLLSFLRIKGYSTKGMSCTDKNTMVFVVLEGEITVVLHTTQFNAKKGDSFYIPPKNYYNLINQKVREAELSLIQFQYDGPLPTVSAASQSGNPRTQQQAN